MKLFPHQQAIVDKAMDCDKTSILMDETGLCKILPNAVIITIETERPECPEVE